MQAEQGDVVPLLLYTTSSTDSDNGGETLHDPVTTPANVYVTKDAAPTNHAVMTPAGKTDSEGIFELDTSNLEPGLYYITTNTWDPAVAILEVFPGESSAVYGDMNADGKINVSDAGLAYAIVKGTRQATQEQLLALDVDGNGKINVSDAGRIYARVKQGATILFPAEQ